MPEIKFKHVVSCTSEDTQFPADNLLATESFKKWKCKIGEKQAVVILQFENSTTIQSIDVGNEGSAFVEILVGRSADKDDNYEVLLASQSFLSPTESRQGTNLNRVRIFNKDQLEKSVADQKWDRLKLVCSQPYNKNVGYGLSFIRLHAPSIVSVPVIEKTTSIGKFTLKDDDEANGSKSSFPPGTMFKQRSRLETDNSSAVAASIPSAIKQAADDYAEKQQKRVSDADHHRKPTAVTTSNSTTKSEDRDAKTVVKQQKERSPPVKKTGSPAPSTTKRPAEPAKATAVAAAAAGISTKPKRKTTYVDFDKLFSGVVFVLSGFENPYRGQLRDKAVQMGAQYKADWGKGCTHLVCAFKNTPKYNQVKGKGKIVKQEWILDSYKQRKRLHWKRYTFEKPSSSDSDEEEIVAKEEESASTKPKQSESESNQQKQPESPPVKKTKIDTKPSIYDASTDEIDTDDEIERFRAKTTTKTPANDQQPAAAAKTDVESNSKKTNATVELNSNKSDLDEELPELPCFFRTFCFLLYGEFSSAERKQLNRYIVAFDGKVEPYMAATVTHVLTHSAWNDDFDEARKENEKLIFVKPEWVLECGRKNALIDINRFLITSRR